MIAIASLLIVLAISLLVGRVATMALMLTGMSREAARFQARSAFTGVGYTTTEAEDIVGHPVRRRIVMLLMLLGNLGIGAVVATLMVTLYTFVDERQQDFRIQAIYLLILCCGLVVLWIAASSRWVERRLNRVIAWALRRWSKLDVRDYVAILQLRDGYAVSELSVNQGDWIAGKSLIDLKLPSEGVLVLGIQRSETPFLGTPLGETRIEPGDTLIVYGRVDRIEDIDQRRDNRRGQAAHEEAVEDHELEKSEMHLPAHPGEQE